MRQRKGQGKKEARRGERRGVIFIVDALLALILVATGIILVGSFPRHPSPSISEPTLAFDMLQAMSAIKVGETSNPYVLSLISKGNITNLNNTIIEQIGEFWAAGKTGLANSLAAEFLSGIASPPKEFALYIEGELIYGTNASSENVYSAKKVISGIASNRTKLGYNARAIATKTRKNNTKILKGDVITSSVRKPSGGNNNNKVNITYLFNVPENSTITNAWWFIEAAWTDNKFKAYINGAYIPGSDATGSKLLTGLEGYLAEGTNELTVIGRYGSGGYEAGDDGASHFVLEYTTERTNTLESSNRHWLAMVTSHASIRYKKPVFINGQLNSLKVYLNAVGQEATLYYILNGQTRTISTKSIVQNHTEWNNSEILSAVQSNGESYSDMEDRYVWFMLDIDEYNQRENYGSLRQILNGSYIEADVTNTVNIYGYMDITKTVDVESYSSNDIGDFYRDVLWSFNVTNETVPLFVDSQLAWLYWSGSDPSQEVRANTNTLYQHPPDPLVEEFARFGYTSENGNMVPGRNTYRLIFGNGYSVNPFNSLVDYTILVPSITPYGETFPTAQEAVDDAVKRLNETLRNYAEALEIESNVISVGNVPSLWGPIIAEVRMWR